MSLLDLLKNIRDDVRVGVRLLKSIEKAVTYRLPRPAPIRLADIHIHAETIEGNVATIIYKVTLKPVEDTPANADVITRKLVTLVDGSETGSQEIPRDVLEAVVRFPQGATCALRGSYVDDAGNEGASTDSETFVASDTLPPDAPGADFASIQAIGEEV